MCSACVRVQVVLQVVISFIVDAFEIGILVVGEDRLYLRHHPHDYHKGVLFINSEYSAYNILTAKLIILMN